MPPVSNKSIAQDAQQVHYSLNHTLGHMNCGACLYENDKILSIDSGLPDLKFSIAADRWLEWRRPYVEPGTVNAHKDYIRSLRCFFSELRLNEIHAGHLRTYQQDRAINAKQLWKRTACASTINHELNTLSQILHHAGLWERLKQYYCALPSRKWTPPRVMTEAQEERLFTIASQCPEMELGFLVASITNNTSASGCELRFLQLKHVFLDGEMPEVQIPSDTVKNEFRARRIPLNETAARSFLRCVKRAVKIGSCHPDHYLFPFRVKRGCYDPTRPASSSWLRNQFGKLRKAADIPWLRPHDLRHQAVTRMLESGAPEQTVMSITGHIRREMLNHYSHTRMTAKKSVVCAIEPRDFSSSKTLKLG